MTKNHVIPYNINNEEYYAADLAEDSHENIWIATYNDGVYKIDRKKNQLEKFPILYRGKDTPRQTIKTIYGSVTLPNQPWEDTILRVKPPN